VIANRYARRFPGGRIPREHPSPSGMGRAAEASGCLAIDDSEVILTDGRCDPRLSRHSQPEPIVHENDVADLDGQPVETGVVRIRSYPINNAVE